jgi:glyoxylase-like metal-dependent hydrolase (beta-lactamase superfamily II)
VIPIREKFRIPLIMAREDLPVLTGSENHLLMNTLDLDIPGSVDILIEDENFKVEGFEDMDIVKTPGHTPGSICLKTSDLLFSGDTIFAGSIGRTDLPGGSDRQIQKSLERIRSLPEKLKLLPGHGPLSELSIEFRSNPFF